MTSSKALLKDRMTLELQNRLSLEADGTCATNTTRGTHRHNTAQLPHTGHLKPSTPTQE